MTRWLLRALLAAAGAALVLGLVTMFRRHQARLAGQAASEEPVVAPSRMRAVDGEALVVLDSADLRRLGLATAPLREATRAPEVRLAGTLVPEPDRVVAVRAPVAGRLGVPEGARWPRFGETVSAGAELAQVSDAKPLAAPRGGVVTQVGAQPGEMVQAGQLLLEITDYAHPLARIAWPPDAPPPPSRLLLAPPGDEGSGRRVAARLVGAAPQADEVTRLPAYLYRADRSWPGARPGALVSAFVSDPRAPARGTLVPDRAVVQWEGLTWAYVERGPGRFARVRVPNDRPVPGGFLAGSGLAPGQRVVVQGAEQLLSEEFRARVTVGEEQSE